MSNTYKLIVNGYNRGNALSVDHMVDMLSVHSNAGVLRTAEYGEVHPRVMVENMVAGIMGSTGRTVHIYNATIIALGADFGTVTIS